MTNEEAIKVMQLARAKFEWESPFVYVVALDTSILALEKQIPEKPYRIHANIFHCGSEKCNARFGKARDEHEIFKYCPFCGQAIDWSDDND